MGLIDPKAQHYLLKVQKIRNAFAHSAAKINFSVSAVSAIRDQLKPIDQAEIKNPKPAYIETIPVRSDGLQKTTPKMTTYSLPGFGVVNEPRTDRRFLP